MELLCNIELIKRHNLTPTTYLFLVSLHKGEEYPWDIPQTVLTSLEGDGWIKILPDKIALRSKFKTHFRKYLAASEIADWINDWRNIWPSGVKTGNRLVRGDKKGCIKKMQAFVRDNPEYSTEDIFDAARVYMFEVKRQGSEKIICADYFIEKNGVSQLAVHLEDVENRIKVLLQIEGGETSFHREI